MNRDHTNRAAINICRLAGVIRLGRQLYGLAREVDVLTIHELFRPRQWDRAVSDQADVRIQSKDAMNDYLLHNRRRRWCRYRFRLRLRKRNAFWFHSELELAEPLASSVEQADQGT
jgi:hypothetical protein